MGRTAIPGALRGVGYQPSNFGGMVREPCLVHRPRALWREVALGGAGWLYAPPLSQEKSGKFTGLNFKGWQQRIFFWLTTHGLHKFTSKGTPVSTDDMLGREKIMIIEAWKQADFLYKGYILSSLEDDLYNFYSAITTSKELRDALEKKYKIEDACLKKFVVAKFLDYKMVDSKTVGSQEHELQLILHDLIVKDMVVIESFQVAVMIEKLSPS
ncbi:uncharacterized protein [Solanum lycopersicum]|uniref:uncharacterized protein n=1 Tax=Solanum lycopersicum TaxID=4081 RepID=UPI0037484DE0